MKYFVVMAVLLTVVCPSSGHTFGVGRFTQPRPTPAFCALHEQAFALTSLECGTLPNAVNAATASVAFSNEGETYEKDQAWKNRIERGACTRLRDRRTDSPADIAECKRDYAMTPICISYKGFASTWYDLADNPLPGGVSTVAFQTNVINQLGSKKGETEPLYYQSPQFRSALYRLLNVAMSPNRKKWGPRDQFTDYAYKICM